MNRANQRNLNKYRTLIVLGTLAAVVTTVGCSDNPQVVKASAQPVTASVRPAALDVAKSDEVQNAVLTTADKGSSPMKATKPITYKSRNYAVSFVYPWQYSFVSAKKIANGDASLQPKADGFEGQFTLARVEIPKGFYPDTDFVSGYLSLSLNQDIGEQDCKSAIAADKDGKQQTETINGVEYVWMETSTGGHGDSSKIRNYAAFANDTCYEVELGVITQNDQGLARELDPDRVMQRLDAILKTVTVSPVNTPGGPQLQSSLEEAPAVSAK